MPNRSDYTIGWICALSTEQIAAEEFLDEEHQAPDDIPSTDSNHYTLGSIGKHNIVITVLPRDEYGIASAANVATNLLRSFPNISEAWSYRSGSSIYSTWCRSQQKNIIPMEVEWLLWKLFENYRTIDLAILQGNKSMVQLFLDKITHPIEKATQVKRMVLYSAVVYQNTEVVQLVFEKDPGLDLKGDYGTELLVRAVEDGRRNRHIIELILEKGARPNVKGSDGTEQPLSGEEVKKRECLVRELDLCLNPA